MRMRSVLWPTLLLLGAGLTGQSASRRVLTNPRNQIFPYVYDGGGWSTDIVLSNIDTHTIIIQLEFSADDGTPWTLGFNGQGSVNSMVVTLTPGASASVITSGASAARTAGYAFITGTNTADAFGAYAVIRNQTAGLPDVEFTEPATPIDENQFTLAFDHSGGFGTAVALVNSLTGAEANAQVTVQDQSGNVLATDQLTIPALGRMSFNVTDRYAQAAGMVGSLQFTTSGIQALTGLGLRLGPNGSLTAIPPFSRP